MSHSELLLVPALREVITVEDEAVTSVNFDDLAATDVGWGVVLLCAQRHTRTVSQNRLLGELLAL